jgi:hypothetical protein
MQFSSYLRSIEIKTINNKQLKFNIMVNQKKQAQESLNKIVDNLLVYTDEVVEQLKPLVKNNTININEWDTYSVVILN